MHASRIQSRSMSYRAHVMATAIRIRGAHGRDDKEGRASMECRTTDQLSVHVLQQTMSRAHHMSSLTSLEDRVRDGIDHDGFLRGYLHIRSPACSWRTNGCVNGTTTTPEMEVTLQQPPALHVARRNDLRPTQHFTHSSFNRVIFAMALS